MEETGMHGPQKDGSGFQMPEINEESAREN